MNKYCKNCYELAEKLKQKEQECEELNKLVEQAKDAPICFQCEQEACIRQEKEKFKKALEEIEEIVKQTCRKRCTNDCLGTRKHCGYGAIFNIINKAKGEGNVF